MIEREPEETTADVEPEDEQTPDEEQAVAAETPTEEASVTPEAPDDDEEDDTLDPEALREEVKELRDRAKDAGLTPLRRMIRAYIDNAIDAADSLLGALEGSSRKKGK